MAGCWAGCWAGGDTGCLPGSFGILGHGRSVLLHPERPWLHQLSRPRDAVPTPPEDLQIAGSTGALALDKPKAAVTWFPVARGSRWHSLSLMRLGNDSSSTRIIERIIFFSSLTFIPDLLFLDLISLLLSKPLEQPLSFLTSCHQMFFSNQNHHSPGQETSRQRHLPVAQHSRWLST